MMRAMKPLLLLSALAKREVLSVWPAHLLYQL
jgi:hypothetical protein